MRVSTPTRLASCALVVTLVLPHVACAELVLNGSFEQPTATSTFSGGTYTEVPPATLPGWTVVSGSVDTVAPGVGSSWAAAYDGVQVLDLNGVGPGSISQALTLTGAPSYSFSFAYSRHPGISSASATYDILDSTLTSLIGGPQSFTSTGSLAWTEVSGLFTTSDSTATIVFTSTQTAGTPIFAGVALDAVSVQAIPEASTWAFLSSLGGVAAATCYFKKRRQENA